MRNLFDGFLYVSISSALLSVVFFFLTKGKGQSVKVLLVLLFDALISDTANEIYFRSGYQGDLIGNTYFVTQFLIICQFYVLQLVEKRREIRSVMISFLVICIFHFTYNQSINEFQGLFRLLGSAIILYYAGYHCIHIYKTRPTKNLFQFFPAWFTAAIIYYFSLNLLLFVCANYVFKNASPEVGVIFWGFHNFNNIVKNILFAIGIYKGVEGR
ncbi:hypothetical protein WSM22_20110 [Cytophagales bacterium WSM2-2]|nr:hypothetical protein WSM22_20110 [Cytophagales bacterium WSM2-2]